MLHSSLSLTELVDIALENNPETEKIWANTKRAEAALGIGKSSNYPTLDATGTVMHAREVKFPNGPNTVFTNYGGELCLSYLLYDFGERSATIEALKEALIAANWSADFGIQRIIYKVASSYYEYLNAVELLAMKQSSLNNAELIFDAASEMYRAGLQRESDVNLSKAATAEIQMNIAEQKAHVAIAYGKLLISLGVPITTSLEIDTNPKGVETPLFREGIDRLVALAGQQRADLLAKEAMLREAKERVSKANKASLPKLRAIGQGGWLEYTKHHGSGYNYRGGITLDIPLFKGFEYTYRKRLALAEEDSTAAELRELREMIALEVLTYKELAMAAEEALKWSSQYTEEAKISYDNTLECYKGGIQNIFDLLQAERSLANATIKKTQAKTEWLVSLAQLAFATGSVIP